jgi:predicted Zn-dependent protease
MKRAKILLFTCACLSTAARARAQSAGHANDVAMRAMRDELARSVEQLRLDTLPKPYFIAYRVTETQRYGVGARLGSLLGSNDNSGQRFISVEVHVGDYTFDNTNYFGAGFMPTAFVGFGMMPLDEDYQEIRRQLWLATDRAYKQAVEALSQKRAALETRTRPDDVPDFSREAVHSDVDETPPGPSNRADAESLVRTLSGVFRNTPAIYNSNVSLSATWSLTRYVNSEGTWFTRAAPRVSLNVLASTQAVDGMPLLDWYDVSGPTQADLPGRDSLVSAVRGLAARLTQMRQVPLADSYEGPVLFEGEAAAELFNAVIAPKMAGTRRPVANAQFDRMMASAANDWIDQIGSPVLPRFLSVVDDPTLRSIDGISVDGYHVDDDGVPARATTVVDHGVLKTLLTTRVPVTGIEHSTGHRRGGGPMPSHVIVAADSALTADELKRKLLALAAAQGRDYAIVVRRIASPRRTAQLEPAVFMSMMMSDGSDAPRIQPLAVFKVYSDGREELVRGAEISGTSAASFKDIVAVSKGRTVYSTLYASRSTPFAGGGGSGTVTYVMPSLLFANVSVRRQRGGNPKLPLVPPP